MKKLTSFVLTMASPLNIWALFFFFFLCPPSDEDLQQTPQASTVQENIDPAPVEGSALLTAHSVPRRCVAQRNDRNDP